MSGYFEDFGLFSIANSHPSALSVSSAAYLLSLQERADGVMLFKTWFFYILKI